MNITKNLKTIAFLLPFFFPTPLMAAGSEAYTPLFKVNLPYEAGSAGNVVSDYMKATKSKTQKEAVAAWEAFKDEYPDDSVEDITSLTLVRQASFELARLYYLANRTADGDREIKHASEITSYDVPEPDQARTWCRSNNYCGGQISREVLENLKKDCKGD